MRRVLMLMLMLLCALSAGCEAKRAPSESVASASVASAKTPEDLKLTARILEAEYRRETAQVPDEARHHADPALRRLAARALARIADPDALTALLSSLSDEDPEVVAWSAYGLGWGCAGREDATVKALVVRAASLSAHEGRQKGAPPTRLALDPDAAFANALARCATGEAEATLVAWARAGGERGGAALRALARLAVRTRRLEDATVVALLDLASASKDVQPDALAPIAHLASLDAATADRVIAVCRAAIEAGGASRSAGVSALTAAAGAAAAPLLGGVLADGNAPASDRAEAARRLAGMGLDGQAALREALASFVPPDAAPDTNVLLGDAFGPVLATLEALGPPAPGVTRELTTLANLAPPGDASAEHRDRIAALRCAAASVLTVDASLAKVLVDCDVASGRYGALAVVRVLERGELTGARAERWQKFASHKDPAVAVRALSLLHSHPEVRDVAPLLASAIERKEPGVVATAARVILDHPERVALVEGEPPPAGTPVGRPDPAVVDALARALDIKRPPDQIETRGLLLRASAKLGSLSVKARAEADCRTANPTVRRHAELALALLGAAASRCPPAEPASSVVQFDSLVKRPVTLTFVTDAGRLGVTLDPTLAPAAVTRVVSLARRGFYDGMKIHRVVPGRAVQFGDPGGDGFGGAGEAPLPCETSPAPFNALSVGMALSGRDTGSSQLFVTLTSQPELDGDYALVGYADLEWRYVAEGDVIRKVVVKE